MLHFFKKNRENYCRFHYDIINNSWDIEPNILKLVILGHFYLPKNPKNQNFEKWNSLLEISSFYTCTKNHNHIMYGSWDTECDRHNFLSFWTFFYPFTPLTIQKIKILKKWKKTSADIITLNMCTTNDNHMIYGSSDLQRDGPNVYFGPFFVLLPPSPSPSLHNNPKNQNFQKMKKHLEKLSFYKSVL